MKPKLYAVRDPWGLDEAGDYYLNHAMAMTREGLHDKNAIAAELGYRDLTIDQLRAEVETGARLWRKAEARTEAYRRQNAELLELLKQISISTAMEDQVVFLHWISQALKGEES